MNNMVCFNQSKDTNEYNDITFTSKTIENTKKHATYDLKNANGHLERAKQYEANGSVDDTERECMAATKDAVDSIEKNFKVLAEMKNRQDDTCITHQGKKNKVKCTHSITGLNNTMSDMNIMSIEDAAKMDSFYEKDSDCNNTHTDLSYGGYVPNICDSEKAVQIAESVENKVLKFREKVKKNQLERKLSDYVNKSLQK